MFADVEWQNFQLAGAFVLGAVLATLATIRVVRAVTMMFGAESRRRLRSPVKEDEPPPTE